MIRILGVRVDEVNMEQVLLAIKDFIGVFRAGKTPPAHIVTINPEGIWLAKNDPDFFDIVEEAALVTADGSGVLWAANKQGSPLPQRVTGIDLMEKICAIAAKEAWNIYLLGAKAGVASAAAEKLLAAFPGLRIVGVDNGYFQEREEAVVAEIAAAHPDILFAALGMPFQEKWLASHKDKLNTGVMIGVGGSFDVISGLVRRAPRFIRRLRLEWLWRLIADPKRWRRYLVIPKFMIAVNRSRLNKKIEAK